MNIFNNVLTSTSTQMQTYSNLFLNNN